VFDNIAHWLPMLCSITPFLPNPDKLPTNTDKASSDTNKPPMVIDFHPHLTDNISFSQTTDDHFSEDVDLPHTPEVPQRHTSPIPQSIISQGPPIIMDVSKIYTQNFHGLWSQTQDPDVNIIPNCECNTTKLEHLVHQMRVEDIGTSLVQETWLEDDDVDMNIGSHHLFCHNSLAGTTGQGHIFCGIAIILLPKYFLAWKATGSPPPIMTEPTGKFYGQISWPYSQI
jgi:hypothetical protein